MENGISSFPRHACCLPALRNHEELDIGSIAVCKFETLFGIDGDDEGSTETAMEEGGDCKIHHWVAFDWEIKFVHVYREGNFAADALATYAFSWPLGLNALDVAPAFLHQFLLADIEGRGCLRLRLCGG
ncbi:putative reverse transcriptase [Senna tora]|uniref:Putative reverse transcriptase n=1 Tax=Senna tora TaxID=362788 RepID=A0A834WLC3_9FABA|nr:putative reverse transcriptase [Senna tora]